MNNWVRANVCLLQRAIAVRSLIEQRRGGNVRIFHTREWLKAKAITAGKQEVRRTSLSL